MARSLRLQLLAWVLVPLMAAVAVDSVITWRSADRTATVVQDRLLLGSARMIAEQLHYEDGEFQHPIPPAALELFQSGGEDRIHYRVTTASGRLLTGDRDLAGPAAALPMGESLLFDAVVRGDVVRVAALRQPVIAAPDGRPVTVEVAQTMNGHDGLRRGLWLHAMAEQVLILVLAAVFVLYGLCRGLRPVLRLRDVVLARPAGVLEPLALDEVPAELAPLVHALNDHVRQLQETAQARQVFIENAAHQLRTPLTLLSTQISFAARAPEGAAREESLVATRQTLQHAIRLVNQLLTLSAAQAHGADRRDFRPLRLDAVVQQALESLAGQAQAKDIDLGFEAGPGDTTLLAHPTMLREIVMNLLDNAIRYTQPRGIVTARLVQQAPDVIALVVEDNGPGIDAAVRERVFERFFRLDDHDSTGSGLGLAIVREFARVLGARVTLGERRQGRGLAVTVAFARQPAG